MPSHKVGPNLTSDSTRSSHLTRAPQREWPRSTCTHESRLLSVLFPVRNPVPVWSGRPDHFNVEATTPPKQLAKGLSGDLFAIRARSAYQFVSENVGCHPFVRMLPVAQQHPSPSGSCIRAWVSGVRSLAVPLPWRTWIRRDRASLG